MQIRALSVSEPFSYSVILASLKFDTLVKFYGAYSLLPWLVAVLACFVQDKSEALCNDCSDTRQRM